MDTPIDRAFRSSPFIPGGTDAIRRRWADEAQAFRERARARLDVPYGIGPRERYDLFLPEGEPAGLAVFVHGGWWTTFDKSSWSHLAAGPLARGFAVAIPSYPLCPRARVAEIVRCVGAAVVHAAGEIPGPLVVAGHSAGGQLAARMACVGGPLPPPVLARLCRVVPISGFHDLRPIMTTKMNETLRIDAAEARAESPVLLDPAQVDLVAWVGDGERPQIRRLTHLLALIWDGLARSSRAVEAPDRHHFDVVEDLADPESALTRALVG